MYNIVESDGGKFLFECKFLELIFENNKIVGILTEKNGEKIDLRSRIVIDASGTSGVIRTSLPAECTFTIHQMG
jgi:flavin-dependent dehydrogenase